jgi:hypothetical protein
MPLLVTTVGLVMLAGCSGPPPKQATAAGISPAARQARAEATDAMRRMIDAFMAVPDMVPLTAGFYDRCSVESSDSFLGHYDYRLSCTRTEHRYFGTDRSVLAAFQDFDRTAVTAGVGRISPAPSAEPTMTPAPMPRGIRSPRPGFPKSLVYRVAGPDEWKWDFQLTWYPPTAERPFVQGSLSESPTYETFYEVGRPDRAAVEAATTRYQYIVEVTASRNYYDQPFVVKPSPSTSPS